MQCPNKLEWNAYLDGEATKDSKGRLQSHLQQCSICQDAVAALEVDSRMIKESLNEMRLPPNLGTYIQGRLQRQEQAWWILKAGVPVLLFSSGLLALAANWIPLIKWLGAVLQTMMGGSLAMQMLVLLGRVISTAAEHVLRGETVGMTPTFIVLVACLTVLMVQSRKGGYDNA